MESRVDTSSVLWIADVPKTYVRDNVEVYMSAVLLCQLMCKFGTPIYEMTDLDMEEWWLRSLFWNKMLLLRLL